MPEQTVKNILTRDYVLGFCAFFGFLAAYHALTPTLPLYLATLGSHEREIGVLVGIIGVSSLVSRLVVGRALLNHSERSVMMGGALLFALTFLGLVVFRPFWPFLVVRLLQGVAFAALDTSAIAYVVRIVPEKSRPRAISYFLLAPSLASAIAATSGVFVVNEYGFAALLFACTGLSSGAFLLSWTLKGHRASRVVTAPAKKDLLFQRSILTPALMCFLSYFSWAGVRAFFPLYSLDCGVMNPGYFFSANAVMVIAVRLMGGKIFDLFSKERIILASISVSAAGVVLLSLSRTLHMFILVGLIWGMAGAVFIPVSMSYALEYAGSSEGSAVGTYQAFMDLGLALGPVIMGLIVPYTGYRVMFLSLALTSLMNLIYFQFYVRRRSSAIRAG